MKIKTTPTDNHEITLTIQVEPEEFSRAKRRAARKLSRGVKIPGFRPGKAPYNVAVRYVGESAIIEEAIDRLADELYPKALDEAGISPGGPGLLEEVTETDPLVLVFTVPLEPEVELGNYKELRVPYEYEAPSDEDVDEYLDILRRKQAFTTTVERPAREGDIVDIILNANWADAPEEQETTILLGEHIPVFIESEEADTAGEWPFPGFSRQLLGLAAGDEKEVEYEFDEEDEEEYDDEGYEDDEYDEDDEYYDEEYDDEEYDEESDISIFSGRRVRFHIKVERVTERELPEADDEFAQSQGDFNTIADLREAIRSLVEEQTRSEYDEDYGNRVLDALVEQSKIKFAPAALEEELDTLKEEFEDALEKQGLRLETYLQHAEQNEEELEEELRKVAEVRLRRTLALLQFLQEEDVYVEGKELERGVVEFLTLLSQDVPEKELRKAMRDPEIRDGLVTTVLTALAHEKGLRALSRIARGESEEPEEETEETEERESLPEEGEADSPAEAPAPEKETSPEETPATPPAPEAPEDEKEEESL